MEPGEMNIQEVIKKWEMHHPPPPKQTSGNEEKPWYQQPLSGYSDGNPRRGTTRRRLKKSDQDYINESHHWQKKFRVIPPVMKTDIQHYQISQCKKCQNALQYYPLDTRDTLKSQTLSLFEYAAAKKSLMIWHMTRYFQSILLAACYQSKDEMMLKKINQKCQPVLFVHDSSDLLSKVLLYLFCASFGKVPYSIVRDEDVSSSVLKYVMKKMGFIFVKTTPDEKYLQSTAETVVELLKSNNYVIVGTDEDERSFSSFGTIVTNVLDEVRKVDVQLKQLLVLPVSLSIEKSVRRFSKLSLSNILQEWLCFPRIAQGLAHFNLSRSVRLKSLMATAADLNEQPSCDEENNLIARHLAFDLLATGAILPNHLVSFLLITKYRDSVATDALINSVDWLVNELRNMDRFLGFSGNSNDITHHALVILQLQNVLDINTETKTISPRTNTLNSAGKLFDNAKKIIHSFMIKALLASSVVACVGGQEELRQGNGRNVKCRGDQILQKAEYLAELVSFLIDFCCPFNAVSDALADSLDKLITMDILSTNTDSYESQTHQKLVHSVAINTGWDDEDFGVAEGESEVVYDLSVEENSLELLNFLHTCVAPFIEISFITVALIREYGEGTLFSVTMIVEDLTKRFNNGLFTYGEMITPNYVSRVLDYLYEKEVINENEDCFLLSSEFSPGNGSLEEILSEIALFR